MNNELKKLQIINKTKKLGLPLKTVTNHPNMEIILNVPDDYPLKSYNGLNNWVYKLLTDDLFEWQRDLDTSILCILNYCVPENTEKIDISMLKKITYTTTYGGKIRSIYWNGECIPQDYHDKFFELVYSNSQYLEDNVFIYTNCNGVKNDIYKNSSWLVEVLRKNPIYDLDAATFENLSNLSDKEREVLIYLDTATNHNISARLRKTKFEQPEEILKILKEHEAELSNEIISQYISIWLETGDLKSLKTIFKNIGPDDISDREKHITLGDYVNLLYNRRFEEYRFNIELMLYVFNNNKKSFLKKYISVIKSSEGYDYTQRKKYLDLTYSALSKSDFWNIINLNELSENDIERLINEPNNSYLISGLVNFEASNKRKLTPKEYFVLYDLTKKGSSEKLLCKLYTELRLSIDESIVRIRELPTLSNSFTDMQEESIIKLLKIKRLSAWKKDFDYITNISKKDIVDILSEYDYLSNYFAEIKNVTDIEFLLDNKDVDGNLTEKKFNYFQKPENTKFLNMLDVTPEQASEFAASGCFDIFKTYYNGSNSEQQANILKIAKADILGKLNVLKYADFDKEVGFEIGADLKESWKSQVVEKNNGYIVKDYDDFKSTMIIGEYPVYSCQSYKSGSYNECLISNFDANKKIIYVTKDGEYLARAILRFTKASDKALKEKELSFMDINEEPIAGAPSFEPCLFLEKAYLKKGILEAESKKFMQMLKSLASKKANEMNINLYCNSGYEGEKTEKYIYISKSKNHKQYLDSLGGSSGTSNEASYYKSTVTI